VSALQVDLLSLSAHKFYGPKGVGALYVRSGSMTRSLVPLFDGGGQERGIRGGTLNVPGIVGCARALQLAVEELPRESARLGELRNRLWSVLHGGIAGIVMNGHPTRRLPNNLNISIPGVEDTLLMMSMKDVAMSTGSACSTATPEPSHVLRAMRVGPERERSAIRLGLGRFTTPEEIEYVAGRFIEVVASIRAQQQAFRGTQQPVHSA
jgi:cysteine desulfurase